MTHVKRPKIFPPTKLLKSVMLSKKFGENTWKLMDSGGLYDMKKKACSKNDSKMNAVATRNSLFYIFISNLHTQYNTNISVSNSDLLLILTKYTSTEVKYWL
jgi:hypothetical protein